MHIAKTLAIFAALMIAGSLPATAVTVKNTSAKEQTIAVDTGSTEKVYTVPAGGSVLISENCVTGCAVTGPWGYSRTVSSNADEITTDGTSQVTRTAPVKAATAPSAKAAKAEAKAASANKNASGKPKAKIAKAKSKPAKHTAAKVKAKGKKHPMPGTFAALIGAK